jgi:hypothetical protein
LLDFEKLMPQILALANRAGEEEEQETEILSLAQQSFEEASRKPAQFEQLIKDNASTTFWPLAHPLEPFGQITQISEASGGYSVISCDGSQIMPTQHELHSCYLLNIGAAVLHYAKTSRAQLESFPMLYHRNEELYPLINRRRVHIDESLVSFERSIQELRKARELAEEVLTNNLRVLCLIDGSLIPFNVDKNIDRLQDELMEQYNSELDAFIAAEIPVMGYISHSRSSDLVNLLRVWRCPYPEARCQLNCGAKNEEEFPCSEIWPLSDRQLLASKLPRDTRSSVLLSGSRWSAALPKRNQICHTYLNTGLEAARVEFPYWLHEESVLLEFSFSALLSQIKKGHGYPVGLSEAHNLAVVRQADRSRLFQLLAEQLMVKRVAGLGVSPKENKKRRGIV